MMISSKVYSGSILTLFLAYVALNPASDIDANTRATAGVLLIPAILYTVNSLDDHDQKF